jgi:hypothetical protein
MATKSVTPRKIPQDHKPKAGAEKGVTIDGIKIVFPTDIDDDWDLGVDMAEAQDGNTAAAIRVMRRLFGASYDRFRAKARGDNGIVSAEKMGSYLEQAMEALSEDSPN